MLLSDRRMHHGIRLWSLLRRRGSSWAAAKESAPASRRPMYSYRRDVGTDAQLFVSTEEAFQQYK